MAGTEQGTAHPQEGSSLVMGSHTGLALMGLLFFPYR